MYVNGIFSSSHKNRKIIFLKIVKTLKRLMIDCRYFFLISSQYILFSFCNTTYLLCCDNNCKRICTLDSVRSTPSINIACNNKLFDFMLLSVQFTQIIKTILQSFLRTDDKNLNIKYILVLGYTRLGLGGIKFYRSFCFNSMFLNLTET